MIYTTTDLIKAIKRNASIPTSQRRFSDDDFLAFLNEELQITMVKRLLEVRQDYFVTTSDTALVASQSAYSIPSSAVGWKLEEIGYVDTNGNYSKLDKVDRARRDTFLWSATATAPAAYYFENDKINTIPNMGASVSGSIRFSYVPIQNELVLPSSCGKISSVNVDGGTITACADNGSGLIRVTVTSHGFETGDSCTIADVEGTTEANGTFTVTYVDADNFDLDSSTFTNAYTSGGTATGATYEMTVSNIPISSGDNVDVISGTNPFNKIAANVAQATSGLVITVTYGTSFDRAPVAGDYVCPVGKTPIPNIPEDFHPVLAQMAVVRCLISANDSKGLQTASLSLSNMLSTLTTRASSRVNSSPTKIVPNNYVLNLSRGLY